MSPGRFAAVAAVLVTSSLLVASTPPTQVLAADATFDPRPGSVTFGAPSAFPSVVASGDGSYHAVARTDGVGQYIQHRVSENAGLSWQTTALLGPPDGGATRPRVAADGDTVAITFIGGYCTSPTVCGEAPYLAVSRDGGRRFNGPIRLSPQAFDAAVGVSSSGSVWLAWETTGGIEIRGTADGGATFPVSRSIVGNFHAPDVSAAGSTAVIAWNSFAGPRAVIARGGVVGPVQSVGEQGSFLPWRGGTAVEARGAAHVLVQGPSGVFVHSAAPAQSAFAVPVQVFGAEATGSISARDGLVAVAIVDRQGSAFVTASSDGGATFSADEPIAAMPGGALAQITVARRAVDKPQARFDWTVPSRYNADPAGRRAPAVGAGNGRLTVNLDGCQSLAPAGGAITEYRWTVDGNDLSDTDCNATFQVDDGATVPVRLEVTATAGAGGTVTHATSSDVTPVDHLIVSIGDSIASGEGNPHRDGRWNPWISPTWEDRACHRSDTAGPARAAAELEDRDPRSSVTFIHLACSGASMLDTPDTAGAVPSGPDDPETGGLLDGYEGIEPWLDPPRPAQLDQLVAAVGGQRVDALLVSIGANDIRFSEVVKHCIADPIDPRPCHRNRTSADVAARLATLPDRYAQLARRLDQIGVANDRVYITEYFDPTVDDLGLPNLQCIANSATIGAFAAELAEAAGVVATVTPNPLVERTAAQIEFGAAVVAALLDGGLVTDDETAWARSAVVGGLNQAVNSAATTHGWNYVGGIAQQFDRHGYCASDPWVVQLGESLSRQHDLDGSFHPDANGHRVYGTAIENAVGVDVDGALTPTAFAPKVSIGDIYVTVAGREQVWASIVRDTGGQPELVDIRQMDRLVGGEGYQGPGTPAADEASAITPWWQVSNDAGALPNAMLGQITLAENVGVRSVTVAQAPADGSLLVAGRQSVVLATIDARLGGPQTIDVTTEVTAEHRITGNVRTVLAPTVQQVKLVPGRNDVLLPVADTFTIDEFELASANVTVSEAIGPGGDPNDDFATSAADRIPEGREGRALKVIALPADVGGGGVSCASTGRAARRMASYASDAMPVAGDGIDLRLACNAVTIANQTEPALLDALAKLDHLARLTAQDVIVAMVPEGWLRNAADGAIGVAVPSLRAVIVEHTSPPEVLAHEIAHSFGVEHAAGVPAEGVRISTNTAPRGIDWMNPSAGPKMWTGGATWDALFARIGGPARTPLLPDPAHPGVWVRGTVVFEDGEWKVGPAQWSPANGSDPAPPDSSDFEELEVERMTLEQRGSGGELLHETELPARPAEGLYEAGSAGGEPLGGVFATSIDLDADTEVLQLRQGGVLVDERTVGAAPTVTVTAPAVGDIVSRGATMVVAWTAVDVDSAVVSADVLISDDGVTWEPLAEGLDATIGTAVVPVPADADGDSMRVRVVVGDGVRVGQDDSDPFHVDGGVAVVQERVVFSRESCCPTTTSVFTMAPDGTDVRPVNLPADHGYDFSGFGYNEVRWLTPHLGSDGRLYVASNYVSPAFGDPLSPNLTSITAIYSSLPDGSDLRRVARLGGRPSNGSLLVTTRCPETSPNGSLLAWHGFPPDGAAGQDELADAILVGNTDGSNQRVLLQGGGTVPADALNSTWVTPNSPVQVFLRADSCPRWSPDGTTVALLASISYRHTFPDRPSPANVRSDSVPMVIDTATGDVRVLADQPRHTLRYYADGGTSFDPFDSWQQLDWFDDVTLYSELSESSGLCGFPFSCTTTFTRTRIDVADAAVTRIGALVFPTVRDLVKVSPIDPSLIYGGLDEFNPSGPTGRNFATYDLAVGVLEEFPADPALSRDVEFDWGFIALGGGPSAEPVVLPPDEPMPAATTGGPYRAVQFEPIVLDAGPSNGLTGDALVEWDLDGDGSYGGPDDAVGVRPEVVFTSPGTRTIRVRITIGDTSLVSDPSELVVDTAPPVEAAPPAPGADGPVVAPVTPTDVSVTIAAGRTTSVTLAPVGTRFSVVDDTGSVGKLTLATPFGDGSITTAPDGVLEVTPADGFTGTATFVVANASAPASTATVTVTVVANQPPVAADDVRTVTLGQTATFAATELLVNDDDPDGPTDRLRVVAVRAATNGDAHLDPAGTVFVTPATAGQGLAEVVVADGEGALATSLLRLTVTPAPTPPGAPSGLVATPGDARVILAWQAPASSEPITGYEVQVRSGGDWGPSTPVPPRTLALSAGPDATSAVVDGLVNGRSYEFRVAARSSLGLGSYSAAVSATPVGAPPAPPTTTPATPPAPPPTIPFTFPTPTSTRPDQIDPDVPLPATGGDAAGIVLAAAAALASGVVTMLITRRRRVP